MRLQVISVYFDEVLPSTGSTFVGAAEWDQTVGAIFFDGKAAPFCKVRELTIVSSEPVEPPPPIVEPTVATAPIRPPLPVKRRIAR